MDESIELKQIGLRIREARLANKMSQADLAFAAGVSVPYISDVELGKTKTNVLAFRRIAESLRVSTDVLLRPNIPEVKEIYRNEFAEMLLDCTPAEIESILNIVREVKISLHNKPEDID